jgi:predicted Zn-dependent protease
MPELKIFNKSVFDSKKRLDHDAEKRINRKMRNPGLVWIISVAVIAVASISLVNAWRSAILAEAYLADLQAQSAGTDGAVLAVLGAKLALADSPALRRQSIDVLGRAAAAGDNDAELWQALAWVYACGGDVNGADGALQQGETALGADDAELEGSDSRMKLLGPAASPAAYAEAVSPTGAQPLLDLYGSGSFVSPLIEAWDRDHPNSSGFRTRELWAESEPNNPQARRLWGLALLKDGRDVEALTVLQGCVAEAPGSADTHDALGQALQASGRSADAELEFLRALNIDPNRVSTLIEFGLSAKNDDPDFAVAALVKATTIAPNSVDAWLALGDTCAGMGAYEERACPAYQEVARLDPTRLTMDDSYAVALMNSQNLADAESVLRGMLRAQPNDPVVQMQLADVLSETPSAERLAEALALATTALQLDSRPTPQMSILAAQIFMAGREPQQVDGVLEPALASHPSYPAAWKLLAQADAQLGNRSAAIQASMRAAQSQGAIDKLNSQAAQAAQYEYSVPFHRQLEALYLQAGDLFEANEEKVTLDQLEHNPNGYRNRSEQTRAMLTRVLGPIAEAPN